MVRKVPRASAGLSKLAASPVPLLETLLELALHTGASLERTDVERQ
jgi:hypothetical protein